MMDNVARLRWQCRRGMLELDAILQPFFDAKYSSLSPEQKETFERLLTFPDPVLYSWLLGYEQAEDPELAELVKVIKSYFYIS